MSGDVAMMSDDDKPLRAKPSSSGLNGSAIANGSSTHAPESSDLSEDDDMPLVCTHRRPKYCSPLTML